MFWTLVTAIFAVIGLIRFVSRTSGPVASISGQIAIKPRDDLALLNAAMRAFQGSGQISFEGVDDDSPLLALPGATRRETAALRSPKLSGSTDDFVVIPLTSENIDAINRHITSEAGPDFFHVQIASGNALVFAAYDDFHPDCVFAGAKFPQEVLEQLVKSGVIRSYGPPRPDG